MTEGTFGDAETTARRSFLSEPIDPDSGYLYTTTTHGFRVLWTPEADDATLNLTCTITRIDYKPEKLRPSGPDPADMEPMDDDDEDEEEVE